MAPQFQEDDDDDDSSNQLESNDNGLLENLNNNQYSNSDKLGFILNNKKLIGDRNPYKLHTSQHHFQPFRRQNNIAEDQVEEEEIVEKSDRLLEQENQIEQRQQQQQQRNWQQQRQDQKNFNDQQDIELEKRYRRQQQQHEFKNRLSKPIIEKIFPPNSYDKQYNLKSSFVLSPNTDFHEISRKFLLKRSSTKSEIKDRFRSNHHHIEISPQRQIRGLDKNNKNLNQISDNSKKLLYQYDTSINGFNGHQSTNNEQQQQNIGERYHYQQFYQQQQQLLSDTITQQDHQNLFENFEQSQQQQHQSDDIFGNRDSGITVEQIDVSRIELTAPFIGILAVSIIGIIIFGVVLLFRLKNLILNGRRKDPANDTIVKDDDEDDDDQVVIKETRSTTKGDNITEQGNVEKLKSWNCKTPTISQKIGDIGDSLCDTIDLRSTEGNSNRKDEKINRKKKIRSRDKDTIKSHCRTDLTDINQLNISDIDRQTGKNLKVMDNGEFILLKRNLNVDENVEKTSNMADEKNMPKEEEEKAKYTKSLSRCDNFNTDDGDDDQLKTGTNSKNLVQTSFHKLKIKTPKTSIDSRLVNFSNNSCNLSSNSNNLSGQISPIPIATMNFGRKPNKSSTSSSTPPISPLCQTTITSSPIPTPSHQQIFPQFAFRNTDKVIYRSLSLTAATASISPPPATPIQYKSTATIVERPILTKSSSLIVTSSNSSSSSNNKSNSNNRLRRLSSTERQQQQSQISIHQQQQNRQHTHLEQQHQGRRYSYRRSGGGGDTNEDQQEISPIVPCAPPTTPHFYHHHQQITNNITTQAAGGGQTQSQSLSNTPNHRQSYSRSNSSESKISKNFDIRPSDDKENEIPAGGELYSPKMKLSEHVLAQQNSPRIFESSSSTIHGGGGGGISSTMTRFSFSPKLIQNNNESSPIMVPAIYTSTSSTSPSAAASTILATPVTINASSTGITHSASPLLSSAIYKHGNYFKFPEVDCFTPDKSRTTTTTSVSAIITGNTLGNSTNKNDTPPTLTATNGPNQQQSGGNTGSGNLSATTRRARLKSISLDSDGAKLVEDNLGIPVEELIEIANQSPTLPDDCFTFEQPSAIGNLSISQDDDDDLQANGDKNDHVLSNYGERKSSITLSTPPLVTPEIVTTITNEIPRKKSIGDTETKYNRKNKNNLTINISRTIDDDIIINDDDDEDDLSLGGRKTNDNIIIGSDEALIYTSGNKNSNTPTPKTPTLTQTKQKAISLDSSDTNIIYCLPSSSSSSITNQRSNLTGLQPRSTASLLHVSSISMPTTPKRQQQQKNPAHYQGLNHLHHGQQHGMHLHNNQHHNTNQQQQQMMFHHHHGGMVLPAAGRRGLVSTVTGATGAGKQIKKPPKLLSMKSHSTASVTSVISPAPSTGSSTSSSATSFDHPQSKSGNSGGGPIGFISKLGSFNENTIDDDDVDEFYLENVVECCPSGNGGMQGSGSTSNIIVHDDDSDYDYHTDSMLPYGGGGGSGIHHHHHHQHHHQHHQHSNSHPNQQHYQSLSTIATTSSSSFLGSNLQNQKCSTLSLSNNNLKTLPEVMTLSDFSVTSDNLPVMDVTQSSAGHDDGNNQFYRDQQQKPHLNVDEQKLSGNAVPIVKPVRSNILQRRGSNHSLTLNLNGSLGNLTKSLSVSNYSLGNSQYSLTGSNYNLNQHQNLLTSASSSTGIGGGVNCMPVLTTTNKNLSTASGTVIYSSNGNITTPTSKKNLLQRRGSNTSLTLNLKGSSCANLSRFNSHSSLNINQQHQQLLQQSYNNNYHLGSTSGMSTTGGGGGGGGGQIKKGLLERRNSNVSLTLNIQNRALSISNCNLRGSACSLNSTNTNPNEYGAGDQQNIRKQPNPVQHLNDYDQQHNSQQQHEQHQQEQFNINFELIKQQRKFLSSENLNHITQCSKLNQTHVRNSTKTCFGSVSDLKPHLHQIYPLGKQQPVLPQQQQQQQHTFIFMDENNPDTIDQTYCSSGIENDGLHYPAQMPPPSDLGNIAIGSMPPPPPPPPPPLPAYRKTNFEQTNLCSCTGLRNITTKPLSPQSTSEDFKMYLANIQFLQNATNILNDVHLRKLNYIFDKSYNTGHSGGHGHTAADHDSGILAAELPIGSREDIPQSLEAASNAKVAAQSSENVDKHTISRQDDRQATLIQISDTDDDDDVDDDQILPSIDEQKMMLRNLHQEFWDLPTNYQEKPLVFGSQAKNRYKTILPNEHSRVMLECEPGSLQEPYINANFIKGPDFTQNSYIATQGPMPNTLYEFWLMICQNVNKISNINKMKCSNNQLTSATMINSTEIQPSTSAGISTATATTTTLLDQQSSEMSPQSAMMMSTRSQKIVMLTNFVESNRQKCSIYFPVEANDIILITSSNEKIDNRDNLLSSVYDKYMNLNQHIINDEIIIDDKNFIKKMPKLNCFIIKNAGLITKNGYTIRKLICLYCRFIECISYDGNTIKTTDTGIDDCKDPDNQTTSLTMYQKCMKFICYHYWFPDWPDHRSPDDIDVLLDMSLHLLDGQCWNEFNNMLILNNKFNIIDNLPLPIIHCSAGIGRTGCLAAILNGLRQIRLSTQITNNLTSSCSSINSINYKNDNSKMSFINKDNCNINDNLNMNSTNGNRLNNKKISETSGSGNYDNDNDNDKQKKSDNNYQNRSSQINIMKKFNLKQIHVDILGIVCNLRLQRGGMVQNSEQYELIHRALCLYQKRLIENLDNQTIIQDTSQQHSSGNHEDDKADHNTTQSSLPSSVIHH